MSLHEIMERLRQPDTLLRAAFYGRHSTKNQEMMMQENTAERFCKKYGCEIVEKYLDPDVSATKVKMTQRKALLRMINDASDGKFDVILVYSDSRLARDPIEHAQIRIALRGIPVFLCDTETLYNPKNVEILTQLIRDGVSKFEVDQTSERTRDTFLYMVKHGEAINGRLPYGYVKREGRFVIESFQQAEHIRSIFMWYSNGDGFSAIAKRLGWLKADRVTPNKERVKSIVLNPFYAGYRSMDKVKKKARMSFQPLAQWIMGSDPHIEPVLSFEEWRTCYDLYEKKQKREIAPKTFKTPFLLAGLLVCGDCRKRGMENFLRGQNRQTRSTFGRTGSRYYECPECRLCMDMGALHQILIDDVFHPWVSKNERQWETAVERVKEKIDHEKAALAAAIEHAEIKIVKDQLEHEVARDHQKGLDNASELWGVMDEYCRVLKEQMDKTREEQDELKQMQRRLNAWVTDESALREVRLDLLNEQDFRRLTLALITEVVATSVEDQTIELDVVGRW
ncbi:recombinase family protein [Ferroacidibacillus organovorans]|uniref:Recombinase domain-containing protein n=1 Tax=Ferroacidibacillus organovorans TaxID=1765683 RepID=A0A853KD27_9BACL|nr:recombinase family protein [Ferroacidibacillus organovorans]KYP81758.1 hypothetical protein AYJ22_05855 [Ferroacidibacillus organovorans]OAG93310.1 hypothetical protein AYW79_11390 [Ferroacidibacillus organovorans]